MKVSEAIEKLTVKRDDALHFQKLYKPGDVGWSANESKAIAFNIAINTLEQIDEPKPEKVEVKEEQAELLKRCEDESIYYLLSECTEEEEELLVKARLFGYTVKPKRWVIKNTDGDTCYLKRFRIGEDCIDGESSGWIGERVWAFTFDDKSKAEAVATLVEGSVAEV